MNGTPSVVVSPSLTRDVSPAVLEESIADVGEETLSVTVNFIPAVVVSPATESLVRNVHHQQPMLFQLK